MTNHPNRSRYIVAGSAKRAAKTAADRIARREFGRRGYCRTLRLDSWTRDGSNATYEAFIGRTAPHDRNTTVGRNIWLYVTAGDAVDQVDEETGEQCRRYSVNM